MPPHPDSGRASRDALAADGHAPSAQWSRLGGMHVYSAGTLLPLLDLECDPKPLSQRLECRAFDPRSMEEDLAPIISRDESKPALLHHPFDFPRCHDVALSRVRVVFYRPLPTSVVMPTLQPLLPPVCGGSRISSTQLHEIPSSWPQGARPRVSRRDHGQLSSCHKVGCMEDRCPLCESIDVDTQFVKQYPHLRASSPRVWL